MDSVDIAKAMMAGEGPERERYMGREFLKMAVQRQMFCQCGQCLDCRRDVYLERAKDERPITVLCQTCWGKVRDKATPEQLAELKVYDGKALYKRGKR